MEKVKEYLIGIICFILLIVMFIVFLEYVHIFGALYLILFAVTIIIYVVTMIKNSKYAEILGKAIMVFLVIGVLSILFRTQMISYGTRYIRYLTTTIVGNNNAYSGYDKISIHDSKSDEVRELSIEGDGTCREYTPDEDIEFETCKIDFSKNDYVLLWLYTFNYMDKIEYRINNGYWIKTAGKSDIESSENIGLFKDDYIYSVYKIKLDYKKIKNGKNTVRIKYGKKENTFSFEVNKK